MPMFGPKRTVNAQGANNEARESASLLRKDEEKESAANFVQQLKTAVDGELIFSREQPR